MIDHDDQPDVQVPFGRWLLTQRDRGDRLKAQGCDTSRISKSNC